jgi:hypothetical protein
VGGGYFDTHTHKLERSTNLVRPSNLDKGVEKDECMIERMVDVSSNTRVCTIK